MTGTAEGATPESALLQAVVGALGRPLSKEESEYCDEACLKRYLRARNGDIRKACGLLHGTLQWRREFDISNLRVGEFEPDLATGRMYIGGHDAHGHPILITRKRADKMEGGSEHYLRFLAFTLETACRAMRQRQEKWCWILDMAGYTRANSPPLSVSLATLRILSDRYPERLAKVFMVDAPAVFSILFTALSPFIDPVTRAKVEFINSKDFAKRMEAAAAAQPAPASAATAAAPATGAKSFRFEDYWPFYKSSYDEAKYKSMLGRLGWPQ